MHWARHDLRVDDNEALKALIDKCDEVAVVYVFDRAWLAQNQYGHCHLGRHRHTFLDQGLTQFSNTLANMNISLQMIDNDPVDTVIKLSSNNDIDCISVETHYGFNEQQQVLDIKSALPHISFISGNSHYLLAHNDLRFEIDEMPDVFSPFRRKVEKNLVLREYVTDALQPLFQSSFTLNIENFKAYIPSNLKSDNGYEGGEKHAKLRINEYFFASDGIATYKETRNGLDGWDFSSRFSAYLANGFITPAYINAQLQAYENQRVKNDSTYWLFFELLWREFFHLQAKKQGALFFSKGGIQNKPPHVNHDNHLFEEWKKGTTAYPIVNAAMKQLAATGFMSNRSRQLVASCFVHELQLDWRYGAAYFEEMLIDYDVASNYGNWQYLAGVGSDPRGHRQFNLEKQTQIYDPHGAFVSKWQ